MVTSKTFHQLTFGVLVIVAVIIIGVDSIVVRSIITKKHDRCHNPFINRQTGEFISGRFNYTILDHQGDNFKLVAWFYQKPYRSCVPLYSIDGVHHYENNNDLPKSKAECEDICGDPCRMDDGTNGICMTEEFCDIKTKRTYYPARPCSVYLYSINCCPKNYSARPIPTIE